MPEPQKEVRKTSQMRKQNQKEVIRDGIDDDENWNFGDETWNMSIRQLLS
jgi:hypothetical protein